MPDFFDRQPLTAEPKALARAAFVISLDFELHWGIRDLHGPESSYIKNILGVRDAIPRILDMFTSYGVAGTWATVGFLFAESRSELKTYEPRRHPNYENQLLSPFSEPIGESEVDDPLHYAPSLIDLIAATRRQEICSHTYSHYYCLEKGADAETFSDDLESAISIASARGIDIQSIVLPRNQWNSSWASTVRAKGIKCFRGNQPGWMYKGGPSANESRIKRLARLLDAHVPLTSWSGAKREDILDWSGLANVRASCFLRPVGRSQILTKLRLRRIRAAMTAAAISNRVFHLWWHPHNFGTRTTENLEMLRAILDHFKMLESAYDMRSFTMFELAQQEMPLPLKSQDN